VPDILADGDGATPLEPDERDGLIPTYIATRDELNAAEQANIAAGILLMARRPRTVTALLDELFVRRLHRAMFGEVWRWAGRYRTTERNIGVDPITIAIEVHNLVADAGYWLAEGSGLSLDEAVCKVHHRLVLIHPFPNGNGRHARAFADLLVRACGGDPFTWGAAELQARGADRQRYLAALRSADANPGALGELVAFARS
jgi:Fic-DOC domain mobile mystery protein B